MSTTSLPRRLPFLGHAVQLLLQPLKFVSSIREFGDVVMFHLGPKPGYMINDPELINELLTTQRNKFTKGGPLYEQAVKLIGNGLFASEGEFYRRQRRLAQPAFHHKRIAAYTTVMREVAEARADSWEDGLVVDLKQEMPAVTMDILTRTLFTVSDWEGVAAEVRRSVPVVLSGVGRRAFLPVDFVHELPIPINRRTNAARRRLFGLVDTVIAAYRATGTDRGDLLSALMLACDPDSGEMMTDEQIRDELITMLSSGTETAATTMVWFFHVLSTHPEIEQRVHAEIDGVLGGRPATHEDLPRLGYLSRVVKETLRMYPTVWLLTRNAIDEVELGSHRIPAGANVFFSAYALHHDAKLFAQPETFEPDRWLPGYADSIPRNAYLPFGAGTRKCIGEAFAHTELMIVLATLASRWRLRAMPGRPLRPVIRSTYTPKELFMTVEARAPKG